jgi:diaminopropionate ammonia-lyase
MAGLNCATPSLIAWPLVSRGIDLYLAVPDAYVAEATRVLAADGIVAGECGAAGLAALTAVVTDAHLAQAREALALGPDSSVLLLSTEGATDLEAYKRLVDAGG